MKHPVGSTITAAVLWRVVSQRRSGVDWRPPRPRTMFSPLAATELAGLHAIGHLDSTRLSRTASSWRGLRPVVVGKRGWLVG
jgi:hypothetical protein